MSNYCPECHGVDHTEIKECPHLTIKEKMIWVKAQKYGHKTGWKLGYKDGYSDGQQNIRDNS